MAVDRLSVTVPSELGAALRALAEERGESVSTIVTEAIARQVRLDALGKLLDELDRKHGPLPDADIEKAKAALLAKAPRPKRQR